MTEIAGFVMGFCLCLGVVLLVGISISLFYVATGEAAVDTLQVAMLAITGSIAIAIAIGIKLIVPEVSDTWGTIVGIMAFCFAALMVRLRFFNSV